jgi:hypothetical protein
MDPNAILLSSGIHLSRALEQTMDPNAILLSSGIWFFLFRNLSSWKWFEVVKRRFPLFLEKLWNGWTECSYCGGFWVALLVGAVSGLHTVSFAPELPTVLAWPLDAFATAIGVLLTIRILDALAALIRTNSAGRQREQPAL